MKLAMEIEARLEAFRECHRWVNKGTIADNELSIRINEMLWVLEKIR
jgi:hypothetical protein